MIDSEETIPVEYEPTAENIVCRYANGVRLVLDFLKDPFGDRSPHYITSLGTCPVRFVGEGGWVETVDSGRIEGEPKSLLNSLQSKLPRGRGIDAASHSVFPLQFAVFPKFALFFGIGCFCLLSGILAGALDESAIQSRLQQRGLEANGVSPTTMPPKWNKNQKNLPEKVKPDDSFGNFSTLPGNPLFFQSRRFLCALASPPAKQDDGQKSLAALLADWNKDDLSQAEAQTAIDLLWADCRKRIAAKCAAEIKAQSIQIGDKTLRYLEKAFGNAPEGERSLWISMHGGGGAPPEVNDSQWKNQIRLYQPPEGFYVAPRAPTDTWNLWHQPHIDGLFDRLIENYTAARGVNPNRVYLMGYSAGGDGVYQLATRMADRWASASMMAGHPNDAQPDNLRNIGFGLFVGGKDGAYKRNQIAAKWKNLLFNLRQNDPNGYPHLVRIYPEMGHWMNRKDAEALPWMSQFRRNPWPKKIIWRQAKGITSRFYWLQVPKQHLAKNQRLTAEVDGQTIRIAAENTPQLIVRLSDSLVNLDHPITVIVNGKEQFRGKVNRSAREISQSLQQRADPSSAALANITLNL